jgi:glycosyltransferase involved in cell wall biosynthesis
MHLLPKILSILAWLIAAAWLVRLGEALLGSGRVPNLTTPEFDAHPEGNPRLVVIVPARNEGASVRFSITSLLEQDYPNLRVIAVDDRSTDATGTILDQLAAEPSNEPAALGQTIKLRVLHVTELPAGWLGKTYAMALAAREAIENFAPEYLLFTDADVHFSSDALRRSLVAATRARADHFVTLPTTLAKTGGEAVMLAFLQVLSVWAVRNWRIADPAAKRDAIGVGAFNLIRTEVYQQAGGFEALRMEVLEDLTLGRMLKRAGFRQRVAIAPGLVSVHWAAGIAGIVCGMTKNFFAVFEYRLGLMFAATLATGILCLSPALLLGLRGARLPSLLAWAAAAGLYVLCGRVSRISPWYALSMPVGAVLVIYAMLRSTLVTSIRGGVVWRGTFYPLHELRRHHAERLIRVAGKTDLMNR